MNIQERASYFTPEINKISDEEKRNALITFLAEDVPDYFWTIPASSSGRFHPAISLGKCGLIRHTKAVTQLAIELTDLYYQSERNQQIALNNVIIASILHDSFKYGLTGPDTEEGAKAFENHGQVAATAWENFCWRKGYYFSEEISKAMWQHMSRWGGGKIFQEMKETSQIVCMADYMASRRFLDFPELHKKD